MIKKYSIVTILLLIMAPALLSADPLYFAIVSPDLPFTTSEMNGTKDKPGYITQFTGVLAKSLHRSPSDIKGKFFRSYGEAEKFIKHKKNVFIMSSVDYYTAYYKRLTLTPVADMNQPGGNRYYVLVKKGRYSSLEALKGKKLTGSVLYGNKRFLKKVVFNGKNISRYFNLKPTRRIYSAVKKVVRGKVDAVILNQRDYNKFKKKSFFSKLKVVYSSRPISNLGVMMVNTPANRRVKPSLLRAIMSISSSKDAAAILRSNGIKGFQPVNRKMLDETLSRYNR
jgi:hypothetical protein